VIAIVGLYGIMAYAVAQRRHELGVRVALGASQRKIVCLVLREGLLVTLAGLAAGTLAALTLARLLRDFLFGIDATDTFTFGAIAGLFLVVAFAACYLPARRAAKVDPMVALRSE
jgi:putative ABC transport system permease protein